MILLILKIILEQVLFKRARKSDIEAYDQAYYGYMYDITNDYKIYLEGQTYELPFDVDSFSN